MRIVIVAVGKLKRGPEQELAERYRERAAKSGRGIGLRSLAPSKFPRTARVTHIIPSAPRSCAYIGVVKP